MLVNPVSPWCSYWKDIPRRAEVWRVTWYSYSLKSLKLSCDNTLFFPISKSWLSLQTPPGLPVRLSSADCFIITLLLVARSARFKLLVSSLSRCLACAAASLTSESLRSLEQLIPNQYDHSFREPVLVSLLHPVVASNSKGLWWNQSFKTQHGFVLGFSAAIHSWACTAFRSHFFPVTQRFILTAL